MSAAYFETAKSKGHNGWIDSIRIDLGIEVSNEVAQELVEALKPNLAKITRKFEVLSFKVEGTAVVLSVVETRKNTAGELPKTDRYEDDSLWIDASITNKLLTIKSGGVGIKDSVAPVILYAQYTVGTEITLDVVYSEPVNATNANPYLFWQVKPAPGKEFTMTFDAAVPTKPAANILRYNVTGTSIPYPVANDSIWIIKGGIVGDLAGNIQDLTVRAPLKLTNQYPSGLELHIVPQPLQLVKVGKSQEPKAINQNFLDYYGISESAKGVAIVLEAKGPITDPNLQRGMVKIIDNTGNAVTEEMEMKFVITPQGTVSGVAVWDGKNRSGRTVGAATYLALVQVEVKFDDREATESRAYRKVIAVTTAKDVLE
jgi:hypothetical protein